MWYQKFIDSVTMMHECAKLKGDKVACAASWDKLYTFVFANFAKPNDDALEVDVKQIVEMFRFAPDMLIEKIKSIPPELAETIFPVAIARWLLRDERIPLSTRNVETFEQFYEWYGKMVLTSVDRM